MRTTVHSSRRVGIRVALYAALCWAIDATGAEPVASEQDLHQVESNLESEQQTIELLSAESQSLLTMLDQLDERLMQADREWRNARLQLQQAERELAEQQADVDRVNQELLGIRARLRNRLRGLYKRGEVGWLGLIFDAQSISAALGNVSLIERAARSDRELLASEERLKTAAVASEQRLDAKRKRAAAFEAAVRRQRDLVVRSRTGKHQALSAVRTQKILHLRAVKELSEAHKNLTRMVATIEQPIDQGNDFAPRKGRLPAPISGASIEVGFGRQVDQRFKTVTLSQGVDLRAEKGTPVRGVHRGVVAYAEPFQGYGLLVILDHGGGYFTLYGHLDEIRVSKGATVSSRQTIGTLGDSGSLKGAYLYFEVRYRGKAVDPEKWVKF